MTRYTYLLIDVLSVIVPLASSFHPRIRLYKRWYALLPAIVVIAMAYVLWDIWFTRRGVWGFNRTYLTGAFVADLPVEELLFFACIPYACVFTYEVLSPLIGLRVTAARGRLINRVIALVLLFPVVIFYDKMYTVAAFLVPAVLILAADRAGQTWLPGFYVVYGILLIPFLVVNGLLTGTGLDNPVVWYNDHEIIGFRILTIPVEDTFYGMGLVLANTWLYKKLVRSSVNPDRHDARQA